MSKLYGSIGGDGRAQQKNRTAQRSVFAAARSHEGSIIASIWIDSDGTHHATIEVAADSDIEGRELWRGTLADLIDAKKVEDLTQ